MIFSIPDLVLCGVSLFLVFVAGALGLGGGVLAVRSLQLQYTALRQSLGEDAHNDQTDSMVEEYLGDLV